MRKVFIDEGFERIFAEKGWLKVPFLTTDEVKALVDFYLPRQDFQKGKGMHYSLASEHFNYRKEVNEVIENAFMPKVKALFDNYRQVFGNFMIKEPGVEGDFPLHQDWTYVSEPELRSAAIWVALNDIDESNGCLRLVEHSHLWGNESRGPFIPWKFDAVNDELKQKLLPVSLNAGEAIIWDHRMIHGSGPNFSNKARMVATAIFVPSETQVLHYTRETINGQEVICKRKVGNDFYLKYRVVNMNEMNVPVDSTVPYQPLSFSSAEFEQVNR